MMSTQNEWIAYDGDIIPAQKPLVPAGSRGLMYGDGVFETIRTYHGHTLLFDEHIARLHHGLNILGISIIPELEKNPLKRLIFDLLDRNGLTATDAIVRLQVWRDGSRGYHPQNEAKIHYAITVSSCPDKFSHPVLKTVDWQRIPSQALPSEVKFTNNINYILAAQQASQRGGDGALMLTKDHFISETTIANIFWIKGNTIFTPDKECDIIPGITRDIVLGIIREHERWQLETGKFLLDDVLAAEGVWITNSVREILPVKQINDTTFRANLEAVEELKNQFADFKNTSSKLLLDD